MAVPEQQARRTGAVAWGFAGQGSQRPGMGAGLFERFPGHCRAAEEILGYSIEEICHHGSPRDLRRTEVAQPMLFVVQALAYLAAAEEASPPDYLAGHSLGEINALFAAGCFDFETGVRLVQERGRLMGRQAGGAMAAVVGLEAEELRDRLARTGLEEVEIANHNAARQLVLSGPSGAIREAAQRLSGEGGVRVIPLAVDAAFHSRRMEPAARAFAAYLVEVPLADPSTPVLSNVTAQPYPRGQVRMLLTRQVSSPVRWSDGMRTLLDRGVEEFREIGSGRVLTGLWRVARRAARKRVGTFEETGAPAGAEASSLEGLARDLGCARFRREFGGLRFAYLAGSMYRGTSSTEMVARLGRAGLMGFFGAGGFTPEQVERAILELRETLGPEGQFGLNLLHDPRDPAGEEAMADLFLRHAVRYVEAAGYTRLTPALVRLRFQRAHRGADGRPLAVRQVVAKVSRPAVAAMMMAPPPGELLEALVAAGQLSRQEAAVARELPVSDILCVESDSGGHTDGGVALALLPVMTRLRDRLMSRHGYGQPIRVGAGGGIGTPEAAAACFVMGADFILTGSINQCTPEAGTSILVKEILAGLGVDDTTTAPAADSFETGGRVQVVRKGTLFAARANNLFRIYRQWESLEEIDEVTRDTLESSYFKCSLEAVWSEVRKHLLGRGKLEELERAEGNPKLKMARVFKWYLHQAACSARRGDAGNAANHQIQCGPAMGAFNAFVAGTDLEDWRQRHVERIAERLMLGAAAVLRGGGRPIKGPAVPVVLRDAQV